MKKRLLFPLLAIAAIMLAACGGGGPEDTVDDFLEAYKNLNIEEITEYVSNELEEEYKETLEDGNDELELQEFTEAEGFDEFKANFEDLTDEFEYEVTDTNVDGDTAEINVDLTYVDASEPLAMSLIEIIGEMFGFAFTPGIEDLTDEEANAEFMKIALETINDNLNDYEVFNEKTSGVITLIEEGGKWLVTDLDDNVANALAFGLVTGMDDFDPFGFDDGTIDVDLEPIENQVDFGDFEVNEDIESLEVEWDDAGDE